MPPFGKKKGSKNEVVFQVHIHSIEPWPRSAADKPLVLAWERGTSHKGTLDASQPDVRPSGVVFEFEETIVVPCTLVQDAHGAYAKKWLILNVAEAGGRKREPIGRVVIDLAEFASMGDGQVQHSFELSVMPAIEAACGASGLPRMFISIGMQPKDRQAPMYFARGSTPDAHNDTASSPGYSRTESATDTQQTYSEDGDVAAAARALQDLESQEPKPVIANGRRGARAIAVPGIQRSASREASPQPPPQQRQPESVRPPEPAQQNVQQPPQCGAQKPKVVPVKTSLRRMSQSPAVGRPVIGGAVGGARPPPPVISSAVDDATADYMQGLRTAAAAAPKGQGRADKVRAGARSEGPETPPQDEAHQAAPAKRRASGGASRWSGNSDTFSLYSDILAAPTPVVTEEAEAAETDRKARRSSHRTSSQRSSAGDSSAGGNGKPAGGSRSSSLNSAAAPPPPPQPQLEPPPASVRHASQQSVQDEEDYFEEDTFAVPDDKFASQPFQPAPAQAPPPEKRSTKLLSIGNLADVDATLLAGRGPSVRSNSRRVMRQTAGAVTNSRKWMRRMNAGDAPPSRVAESRRSADFSAPVQEGEEDEGEEEAYEDEELEQPHEEPPQQQQQPQPQHLQAAVPPAIIEEEEEVEETDEDEVDPKALVARFRQHQQAQPRAAPSPLSQSPQQQPQLEEPQQPQHNGSPSSSDDIMAGIAARRAAERAAAALPGGLNGRMTPEEQDNVSRLSNMSNASAKSDDSAMSGPRKPRGARRASSLFSDRTTNPKSMRALAAAAAAESGADSGSDVEPVRRASPLQAKQQQLQRVVQETGGLSRQGSGLISGGQAQALLKELRTVAALESAVYLARSFKGAGPRPRQLHAPARRLARTTISLGPKEGIMFGLRSIRAIEAAVDGCAEDVPGLAHWWSNCLHLRWMLWAMCRGDDDGSPDEFDWVMQVLVPPLREMEAYVFDQMVRLLWRTLIEGLDEEPRAQPLALNLGPFEGNAGRRGLRRNSFGSATLGSLRKAARFSPQELAAQRWLESLAATHRVLVQAQRAQRAQHVNLLLHRVLTAVLHKLDAALFSKAIGGEDEAGFEFQDRRSGAEQEPELHIKDQYLPFAPGPLTCGQGIQLKMALTRWSNWATDVGIRDLTGSGRFTLFPRLRATADLLMMPKEVLADRGIRNEVVPSLSVPRIRAILQRFRPDDYAPDPLPHGLLEYLANETPTSADAARDPGPDRYEPPDEGVLLQRGLIEPVSLELDEESDEELEVLSGMYAQEASDSGEDGTHRYSLLRELWSSAR